MGLDKYLNPKNILAIAAAPFTAGASMALLNDGENTILDHITGAASAKKANEQNMALQHETNQMSIDLANTAHQREVADLEAAGLNPILSAGGTGAAVPTLGTAQVQNTTPGGLMGQATQAAQIVNLAGTAKQAISQAKLNNVNSKIQPAIAKADIASKFAQAGSAKAQADYTQTMKQFDMALKDAEIDNIEANTYRTKNISKGEQTREWIRAITGGASNMAHTAKAMTYGYSPVRNIYNNYY